MPTKYVVQMSKESGEPYQILDKTARAQVSAEVTAREAAVAAEASAREAADATKVPNTRKVNGHALSSDVTVTKGDVGLGNVDNTSDANKPVSTATQTALDGKVPTSRKVNGHALSSDVTVTKGDVGLGNVDNTSDANKPISTAQAAVNTQVSGIIGNTPLPTTSQTLTGAINEIDGDLAAEVSARETEIKKINDFGVAEYGWSSGYIRPDGTIAETTGRKYSTFLVCPGNASVTYRAESDHSSVNGISFYNGNLELIGGYSNNSADKNTDITVTSPENTMFARISINDSQSETAFFRVNTENMLSFVARNLAAEVSARETEIKKINDFGVADYGWSTGYIRPDGRISETTGRKYSTFLVCPGNASVTYVAESDHASINGISFYNANLELIGGYSNNSADKNTEITVTSPENTMYARISIADSQSDTAFFRVNMDNTLSFVARNALTKGNIYAYSPEDLFSFVESTRIVSREIAFQNLYSIKASGSSDYPVVIYYTYLNGEASNTGFREDKAETVNTDGMIQSVRVGIRKADGTIFTQAEYNEAVGIVTVTAVPLGVSGQTKAFENWAKSVLPGVSTRIVSRNIQMGGYDWIKTFVPDGYEVVIFSTYYDGTTKNTGYVTGSITVADAEDLINYSYISIRKPDNTAFTQEEIDDVISGTMITTGMKTKGTESVAYVSPGGKYKTVSEAVMSGATRIMISEGIYKERISLSNITDCIELINNSTDGRVIFKHPDYLIAEEAINVSGYTKVKQCEYSGNIGTNNGWIYQENVPYGLITDAERHPAQRGKEYRCDDTPIIKTEANTLQAALDEIEGASDFRFFHDTTNGILYFSSPKAVSVGKPITRAFTDGLFTGQWSNISLKAIGIEVEYMQFNAIGFRGAEMIDCKATKVTGAGCFRYDNTVGAKFVRCEAALSNNGTSGDGFNGHSVYTGDPHAKKITCELIDCWAHDIQDDGYSDHECSEIVIRGGLYEYCGKAGVTPSYGSHCCCYGVTSRNNFNGFLYTGTVAEEEGGMYGQLQCVSCIAENNTKGSEDGSTGSGFSVRGTGNSAKLISCKSIGNRYGYSAGASASMELIDCGEAGSIVEATSGAGTISTNNTNTVVIS